jgi:hypothetical protein
VKLSKSALITTAVAATSLSLGGAGLVSAAGNSNTTGGTSLVDKIAAKFNLNKSDVQAVFDQNHAEKQAQREQKDQDRLNQAVKDGALTQAQADHINQVHSQIKQIIGNTSRRDLSQDQKQQIKTQMDDLRQWAQQNNVNLSLLGHGRHLGRGTGTQTQMQTQTE